MKIKRYLVRDMPEALAVIRQDLGSEAVIVSNRRVHSGGWRGFFSAPLLEVTAAVDDRQGIYRETESRPDHGTEQQLRLEVAEVKTLLHRVLERSFPGAPADPLERWRNLLLELEIGAALAEKLTDSLPPAEGEGEEGYIMEILTSRIASLLGSSPAAPPGRIYAFIGPTGVGKTTTLAKLAAQLALYHQKKVGLVTVDTYRIGALDQLKTYGEILGLPVDVVLTPRELKSAIERHSDKDVILVDTAGRPSHNAMNIAELRGLLAMLQPLDTFLVLSVTTKNRDLLRLVEEYRSLHYNRLIFTKLDETQTLGAILNVVHSAGVPVAYWTNGQNVPDDICVAEPQQLAKMILGAMG